MSEYEGKHALLVLLSIIAPILFFVGIGFLFFTKMYRFAGLMVLFPLFPLIINVIREYRGIKKEHPEKARKTIKHIAIAAIITTLILSSITGFFLYKESQDIICGNGIVEGNEKCDGSDLRGKTCKDLGYDRGTLGCTEQCTYDTTQCEKVEVSYKISTCQELQDMQNDLNGNYTLQNDIDCSATKNWKGGKGFKPIGNISNKFKGSLNGNGYRIKNLYIDRRNTNNISLFGYTGSKAKISNIGLEKTDITGNKGVGGLVGINDGNVLDSYITGTVTGSNKVGGLIGHTRSLEGNLPHSGFESKISNSHSSASIKGDEKVGGLIGYNAGGKVSNSYATGPVEGKIMVGGLIGESWSSLEHGDVSGCYTTGSVDGNWDIGGLIGRSSGSVSNSYATGSVTGGNKIGGLIGNNQGDVFNSYATGKVSEANRAGGLIGLINEISGSVSDSFWNTETSGIDTGIGKGSSSGITGLTTSEMKSNSTFTDAGWNFQDVWYMSGYPHLQWEK